MTDNKRKLGREEVAKIEVGHTTVTPARSWALIGLFALTVAVVPLSQLIFEMTAYFAGERDTVWPQPTEIFQEIPAALEKLTDTDRSLFGRVFKANATMLRSINTFEDNLEDEALLAKLLLSPIQSLFAEHLGAGNEEAYVGRGQWLFYRPGIDYVMGPAFLDPVQLAKRASGGNEWQPAPHPDPRTAIIDFKNQLAERGIALIVMPTPIKPAIHPEQFSAGYSGLDAAVQNPSYEQFKRDLEEAGVLVCDVAEILVNAKRRTGRPQYLATDTHWRPEAMELAAQELKDFIEKRGLLQAAPPNKYKRETAEVENLGDIAVMLKLPADQRIYETQKATIHQVLYANGELWRPNKTADLLLMGDSFTNVYSVEAMGWGTSAGLAEQLSYYLQRQIDCIARNDNGSFATREMLSVEFARGRDRLESKRLVVYQFAVRELAVGDWKTITMTLGEPRPSNFVVPDTDTEMLVAGVIEEVSPVPKPGSVPYKDHIVAIHLIDLATEDGPIEGGEAVVYMWSMRDNVWTPAARYRAGKKIKLRLKSWYDVYDKLDAIKRSELSDDVLQLEDPCWGEEVNK